MLATSKINDWKMPKKFNNWTADNVQPSAEIFRGDTFVSNSLEASHQTMVSLRVYRTSYYHFAAVFPTKKFCNPLACINLKNFKADRVKGQSNVVILQPKSCDGSAVILKLLSGDSVDSWMDVLSDNSPSPSLKTKRSALPSLAESEEE